MLWYRIYHWPKNQRGAEQYHQPVDQPGRKGPPTVPQSSTWELPALALVGASEGCDMSSQAHAHLTG
jgi:hypothetical protein